jgi:hypothetical protein
MNIKEMKPRNEKTSQTELLNGTKRIESSVSRRIALSSIAKCFLVFGFFQPTVKTEKELVINKKGYGTNTYGG